MCPAVKSFHEHIERELFHLGIGWIRMGNDPGGSGKRKITVVRGSTAGPHELAPMPIHNGRGYLTILDRSIHHGFHCYEIHLVDLPIGMKAYPEQSARSSSSCSSRFLHGRGPQAYDDSVFDAPLWMI